MTDLKQTAEQISMDEIQNNDWRSNNDIAIELMDAAADADTAGRPADARFMRLAADRLSALSPRVKALEWSVRAKNGDTTAQSVVGEYSVGEVHGSHMAMLRVGERDARIARVAGFEQAKAAAQADYERRILSAIEVSAAPRVVTDEEVERYVARCREMSQSGEYEWWSRLADILDALSSAGDKEIDPKRWREHIGNIDGLVSSHPTSAERKFPTEAYEWNDDVTKEAVDKLRDDARKYLDNGEWEIIDGSVSHVKETPKAEHVCGDVLSSVPTDKLEVVAHIQAGALAELRKHKDATATVSSGLLYQPFGDPVPLVRQSDANRIITEQAERIAELHGRLMVEGEAVTFYRAAAVSNRRRAESAEADRDRMKVALEKLAEGKEISDPNDDHQSTIMDYWDGEEIEAMARAALSQATGGQANERD